jgi:hypothetical protein
VVPLPEICKNERPNERNNPMKDIKGPVQNDSDTNRKGIEEPSRQYLDLTTGQICVDGYEPTSRAETEDPNVSLRTEHLSNVSPKPSGVGVQK